MSLLDAEQTARYVESLTASVQALEADLAAARAKLTEREAVLESVAAALVGDDVSDFMESFPLVRGVLDSRAMLREAEHSRQLMVDEHARTMAALHEAGYERSQLDAVDGVLWMAAKLREADELAHLRWDIISRLTKQHNDWKAQAEQAQARIAALESQIRDGMQSLADGVLGRAERAEARIAALEQAITAVLAEPFGCPFCDSGKLRNPEKGHADNCGFALMQQAQADARGREAKL